MFTTSWLWIAAALYLLFEMWRGWRRGIARHGVSVTALLVAGGVGWIFSWMTGFVSDRIVPLPPPAGRALFGFAAGLAFYISAVVLASLLLKKTSQQKSGLVRFVYGAGGAFFGLIFGLLILWGGVTAFRMLGAVSEARTELAEHAGGGTLPVDRGLISAKASLEHGATGKLAGAVDVLPADFYETLTKLLKVSGSPDVAMRLLSYPPLQKLLAQPKLAALLSDRDVARAAAEGNYMALLANPQVVAVASDPEVQESFIGFDWQKALDYALQEKSTSPAP